MTNFLHINIDEPHLAEFRDSAIAPDITALNFRSFDGSNENELDEAFILLIEEPDHNNNGTLAGKSQNDLAKALRSGGWIFEGYRGKCIKPDSPRQDSEGKIIKYESPRGEGTLQLFIPRISWAIGRKNAAKAGSVVEVEYLERMDATAKPSDEDCHFWDWYLSTNLQIVITEGSKKACSLISAGYPALGLNGIWGWGTNIKDEYGNVEKDGCGKSLKNIHPDLEPFLDGREIVIALDREATPDKVKRVNMAKAAFVHALDGEGIVVTDLKWRNAKGSTKGIDDYIAAKGVKALDEAYAKRSEIQPPPPKEERQTGGDRLLAIAKTATYFHTADKIPYADIWIEGNRHTYPVRSKAFRLWLSGEYLDSTEKGIGSQTLQDTLSTLEAIAIFRGETRQVHLRTAEHQGKIYIDLGTPDWKAIEVDSSGWRLVSDPPVRFWRPDSLLPLPYPVEGGSLEELKELLNVDGSAWILIITFLLFCFCPGKTYPVLVISAHRGSGKTAAAEILKGLIDPGKAALIKLQGDTLKLAVTLSRRWLAVYDNVGHISPEQSDDLCRVATNFGYSTRTLHTTDEETTFELTRPQIITAIDALVTRDDLADRVLMVQLLEITEDKRLPQAELNTKVEAARPLILGALLTALSQTLAAIPDTKPKTLPRMADYALFAIASEKALGLKDGEFMKVFNQSREQSRQVVIESSPVGEAIVRLMENYPIPQSWKGTASELLKELEKHTDEATYRSRYFPKASNLLSRQLKRLTPDLKSLGINLSDSRIHGGTRLLVLEKVVKVSSPSSPESDQTPDKALHKDSNGDDNGDDTVTVNSEGDDTFKGDDMVTIENQLSSPTLVNTQQHFYADGDDGDDKKLLFTKADLEKSKTTVILKVGDRVQYVGNDKALQRQYAGILEVCEIKGDRYTCKKPSSSLTSWIELDDLQLVEVTS
jgi:Domain of unknown function (DUF3854)